jgi:hypothetical protein
MNVEPQDWTPIEGAAGYYYRADVHGRPDVIGVAESGTCVSTFRWKARVEQTDSGARLVVLPA